MFPGNLTDDGLPKPNVFESARNIILESYMDGILPVHGTVILKTAYCRTGKLMPIRFFMVETKNEIIISHATGTQLGLLKVLCHNRTNSIDI